MRYLFVAILSLFFASAYGQDSTEIKLQRYKDLREQGLITESEYDALKKKELNIASVAPAKKDTVDLKKLKHTYKVQLVTGAVWVTGAVGFIGGGVYFKDKPMAEGFPEYGYHTKQARIFFVIGGVLGGVGIYSFVKGAKNRHKYIELSGSPDGVSMRVTF